MSRSKTNVEINDNKYFRVTATIGKNPNGTPIRKQFYGSSKKNAKEKRDEFMAKIHQGLSHDYKEMTIDEFMHVWLFDVVKNYAAHATFERYESVYRNYVLTSPIAQMKVYEVKSLTLQRHYNEMAKQNYTSSQIYNLNKLLKTFFNYAITEDYILRNPCFGIVIPKDAKEPNSNDTVDPLTDEEIEKIMDVATGTIGIIFTLGLATGLRRGELLGLQGKYVDLEKMELNVCQALKRVREFQPDGSHEYVTILEDVKTENSNRKVPIPSNLKEILLKHRDKEKKKHEKLNIEWDEDESLFFTSTACTPLDGKNILTSWKRLQKRADVRERSFHNIRHTYATKLFENEVPLKTTQMLLGHADISITANTYTHVMPEVKDTAVDKLNYLFD